MNNHPVREVTDTTFADAVAASADPVVVEFFATGCSNCHGLEPTLERVAADHAQVVRFVKVNADDNPGLVAAYDVSSTATMVLIAADRRNVGAVPVDPLDQLLVGFEEIELELHRFGEVLPALPIRGGPDLQHLDRIVGELRGAGLARPLRDLRA